jgi:hypothetical protein
MIAVLAVAGLVAAADAQSKARVPENAGQLTLHPGNGATNSSPGNGPSPQWSIGWNIVHAGYCNMYDYAGYTFLVLYPVEGGAFWTVYPAYQNVIEPACQTGNAIAFHIFDYNNDWDQIWTFTYK